MTAVEESLALARQQMQAGDLDRAEALCRQLVAQAPAEAWSLLGAIHRARRDTTAAVAAYRQALQCGPPSARDLNNLGSLLHEQGQQEEAAACFTEALRLRPDYTEAHYNRALVRRSQHRLDEAAASFREALRLRPGFFEAANNLGLVLLAQGELTEAEAVLRQAVALRPELALGHANLATVLRAQGRLADAVAAYRWAVQLQPGAPDLLNACGLALKDLGQLDEAAACFQQALQPWPTYAEALSNLGLTRTAQGELEEAVACFTEALQQRPDLAEIHANLGLALRRQGRLEEAAAALHEALRLRPDCAEAHNTLGGVLQDQGDLAAALACYREAVRLGPDFAAAQSNVLFCLNNDPAVEADALFQEHRRWGEQHDRPWPPHANEPDPGRRLRVGYVSPDFRRHAVARFFEPILAHHDPAQVEVFCYAEVACPDATTERLRALAHGWRFTCGLSDAQVAEQVRADRIDLLIDLAGHTANNRLLVFARKPAPVQATFLGYPNTTGLRAIDYKLTDAVLDPPSDPVRHTETLVRLPCGLGCFQPPATAPAVSPLPAQRQGCFTLGSLHGLARINEAVLDLWSQVLHALPAARLLLRRDTLTGAVRDRLLRQFAARGIAAERLELRHAVDARGHLGVYDAIDLALDVFPWSGCTTTCEALWMGVPVLTLYGNRHAARLTAAVLTAVGLTETIAATPAEFVARAAALARREDHLAELRAGLRERVRASLCDGRRAARQMEEAYRRLWRAWCASRPASR